MKKTKRYVKSRIVCGVLLAVLAALGIFLCVWFFGADYSRFDARAKEEISLPELSDGFVPQGMCPLPENERGYRYAVSGYYKEGVPSRIYLLGGESPAYVTVRAGGETSDEHFGGVAATDKYLLVASGKTVVRIHLNDVYAAALRNGEAEATDVLETDMGVAYCSVFGDKLFVGEFYRAGNYETAEDHRIERAAERNPALVYCYEIDDDAEGGVGSKTPYAVLSVRGLVQGIAVTENSVYLSCSWGLSDSGLYCYRAPFAEQADGYYSANGKDVPLYFLGNDRLVSAWEDVPCMSEAIFARDGRLYVLFESACNKYKYFVRRQMHAIVSLSEEEFTA